MSTSEIISIILKAQETGKGIRHPKLETAFESVIKDFTLENINHLQQTAMQATVEPNTVAANFITALQEIPTVIKLSKRKLKGDILDKHTELHQPTVLLQETHPTAKSTQKDTKQYTAEKQSKSAAHKKSKARNNI